MKRRISLTPGTIEALKEGKLLDPPTPALFTEINAKGRAVWHYRRRILGTGVTFKRTLGLFPAFSIADARAWAARFNELLDAGSRIGHAIYGHGEQFYGFSGLRSFKAKFRPHWVPRYVATPPGLAAPRAIGRSGRAGRRMTGPSPRGPL